VSLSVRKLDTFPRGSNDYRSVLKEVARRGDYHMLVDCQWYTVQDILHQVRFIYCFILGYVNIYVNIYLSIGINVRFAAMMADVGDGLL